MPLSPADVAYLNKLMDRHLKHQRSWPWVRYTLLVTGVLMVIFGIWMSLLVDSGRQQLLSSMFPAPHATTTASTYPVTQGELQMALETSEMKARMNATQITAYGDAYIFNLFFIIIGLNVVGWTLSKWNHHRRDAILIKLLQEKCAAELTMPPSTAP
jgi:hypothetical protein